MHAGFGTFLNPLPLVRNMTSLLLVILVAIGHPPLAASLNENESLRESLPAQMYV